MLPNLVRENYLAEYTVSDRVSAHVSTTSEENASQGSTAKQQSTQTVQGTEIVTTKPDAVP